MLNEKDIVKILKKIKEPESEQSLFDLKIVKHVDYKKEEEKLIIALDFDRRMPSCFGCKPIAWMLQQKIVRELEKEFSMFSEVKNIDFKY